MSATTCRNRCGCCTGTSPNCTAACTCTRHERGNLTLTWPAPARPATQDGAQ